MMSTISKTPLAGALSAAARELYIACQHAWACAVARGRYGRGEGFKLHLGCGRDFRAGWINIDLRHHADLRVDLRKPLPFRRSSAGYVYAEHLLEHLPYPGSAFQLLQECERVLAPGGQLRIGVPDTEWVMQAYAAGERHAYFQLAKELWHPDWCQTMMEHVNHHFRDDGDHHFAYDFSTLEALLMRAGFARVSRSAFDAEKDSEKRATGTLYVDAWTAH